MVCRDLLCDMNKVALLKGTIRTTRDQGTTGYPEGTKGHLRNHTNRRRQRKPRKNGNQTFMHTLTF